MIRRFARGAALIAVGVDGMGAWLTVRHDPLRVPLAVAALVTGLALVPCAIAFAACMIEAWQGGRLRLRSPRDAMRLPIGVPRGYVGAAVLGAMATLTAMGRSFAFYVFAAGVALVALALSQARPR